MNYSVLEDCEEFAKVRHQLAVAKSLAKNKKCSESAFIKWCSDRNIKVYLECSIIISGVTGQIVGVYWND